MQISDTQGSGLHTLDRELLLSHILQKPRSWIVGHTEYVLSPEEEVQWIDTAERRKRGEPVAYITGEKEFYGRMFTVDPSTLIPRPATEVLIDASLKVLRGEEIAQVIDADTEIVIASDIWGDPSSVRMIADIGTGSGCIGITLACELPSFTVIATDISMDALHIAQKNAERHNVLDRISFVEGDALDPVMHITEPFLLVSNPPYIPESTTLMKDVQAFEPHTALFAGKEGTDVLEKIKTQAKAHPFCQGIIVECRKEQSVLLK